MNADYPTGTTIAPHTNGSKPHAAVESAPTPRTGGGARRIIVPALLALTAFVLIRRLQGGLSAS